MNKLTKILFSLIFFALSIDVNAQLKGLYLQDWVTSYLPSCYKSQRASAINSLMSDERLSKYCTCSAFRTGLSTYLSNELVDRFNLKQAKIPSEIHDGVIGYCTENYANYNSGALPVNRKSPPEFIYNNGVKHRFTAVGLIIQDLNRNQIESKNFNIGENYVDVIIESDSKRLNLISNDGKSSVSTRPANISEFGKILGIDYGFSTLDGIVSFDIEKSVMVIQRLANDKYYTTTYVLSKKLICESLSLRISERNSKMVGNLIKEALIFAAKSYAGASYSYGTVAGLNSSGNPYTANVTFYNNSWMGEHYSNGLDELFNGSSDVSSINKQKQSLNCPS